MTISSIDLCSRALLKIGANPISSLDDGTTEARVCGSLYPFVRDGLLTCHSWNFATHQENLPRLAIHPVADFSHAYSLPANCLRVLSAGPAGSGHGLTYRIRQNLLVTDSDTVIVTFISRPPESAFPPFFNTALVAKLAAEFSIPLTDSTSRWQSLNDVFESELARAKLADTLEDSPNVIEDFSLIEGRV